VGKDEVSGKYEHFWYTSCVQHFDLSCGVGNLT